MFKYFKKKYRDIAIIIPAYKETENLKILTRIIFNKFPEIKIFIVDDSAYEENQKLQKALSCTKGKLKIISRFKKMGRGSAVIEGFKQALKDRMIKFFFEMDADLAHDPLEIPLFLEKIDRVDVIVGSRYLAKSKIVKWPLKRLIQSKLINLFLKIWLSVNLTDYTNGYRAYNRRSVEFLVHQKLKERGFISLSETAFKLRKAGFKISEVAITFRDRRFGESSANFRELMTSLYGAIRIRFSNGNKFFGISAKPVYYGFLALIFIVFNYSFTVWFAINKSFGIVAAKVIPETIGIIFFLVLSKIYLSRFYPKLKINLRKNDVFALVFLIGVGFLFHFKQFYMYFWKDDIYFFLNRVGTSYSFYQWGPWISSYPLWVWELIRSLFGYSILPYQVVTILSHVFLGFGVYLLVKYLSKSTIAGIITAFLIASTPITFEAFQWITQPMNFAWQGFLICVLLIALVWELEEWKGHKVPYLSSFIMMGAFGAGIARIGFVLPLISTISFFTLIKYFRFGIFWSWAKNLFKTQWIYYFMVVAFFITRGLFVIRGTKAETVTAPLYRIYLYLVGVSSFPIEFFISLSKAFHGSLPPGVLIVWFAFFFLVVGIVFLITIVFRRKMSAVVAVGFLWLIWSAMFLVPFAPHLPATDYQINYSSTTSHLSYLTSVGALIIWGFLFYKILTFLWKIKKLFGQFIVGILIVGAFVTSYLLLSRQYDVFLDFAKGVKIPRQKFFFETYRKYIPADAKKVNIFYDDGALKRRDNYKPNEYYFWAFWDPKSVRILYGDSELKSFLASFKDLQAKDSEINSLYGIYTDYDNGLIEDNLSLLLRDSVYNPIIQGIPANGWKVYWGTKKGNVFLPEIFYDRNTNTNYFKNPVMFVDQLNFPSVLTPKLKITLNVQKFRASDGYVDLRAGILSQLLNNWTLPSNDQSLSLVKYYFDNPSQSVLAFNDLLKSVHVNDKMVCGQNIKNDGVAFLIAWFGEPDSYHLKNRNKELLSEYLDKHYSICYFPNLQGQKEMDIELPNLGSILRHVMIIPLTKKPISIQVFDASISSPKILD